MNRDEKKKIFFRFLKDKKLYHLYYYAFTNNNNFSKTYGLNIYKFFNEVSWVSFINGAFDWKYKNYLLVNHPWKTWSMVDCEWSYFRINIEKNKK